MRQPGSPQPGSSRSHASQDPRDHMVLFSLDLSWLSCRLLPLVRLSCSVRGAGSSRPEPWTRLHCSELHWRDPVALSVGQPGASVSSKDCAHGSDVLFRSRWHPASPLGGEWKLILDVLLNPLAATMQGTAGMILRRRSSGST